MAYEVILHSFAHKKLLQKKLRCTISFGNLLKTLYWDVSIEPQSEMQKRLGWPQGRGECLDMKVLRSFSGSRADSLRFRRERAAAAANSWRQPRCCCAVAACC